MNTIPLKTAYMNGQLEITRDSDTRFTLKGNYMLDGDIPSDHFQLIYEALEVAAHSDDKFKVTFRAFCDELMSLTADWDQ